MTAEELIKLVNIQTEWITTGTDKFQELYTEINKQGAKINNLEARIVQLENIKLSEVKEKKD